jgi:hypothetical protein
MKGSRIHAIVRELQNENIDVINFTENLELYIQRALSPAKIGSIKIDKDSGRVSVYLKPDQVSLAIGKGGLNIKLASRLQLVTLYFGVKHIESWNTFGNTHDQLDTAISSFKDRVFTESSGNVNYRSICTGSSYSFFYSIEHWQAEVSLATFTWSYTTNHFGAVSNGLFRVKSTLGTSETLANNFGVFVN